MKELGKVFLAVVIFFVSIVAGAEGGCAVGGLFPREWSAAYGLGISNAEFLGFLIGSIAGLILGITMISQMWRRRDL